MCDNNEGNCNTKPLMLLQLPDIILEKIIGYLSFHEISQFRIVCQRYNDINKQLLNRGFRSVELYHLKCQKEVKGELPRRESERRDHPLAHHCNILSGIETRLSLLNMTFLKYVDAKFCCFIPGKVIDEIFRVLRFVQTTKNLFINGMLSNDAKNSILKELRANVILKELRDISSMAMEHFEEFIMPMFKTTTSSPLLSFYSSSPPHFSHTSPSLVSLQRTSCNPTNSCELQTPCGSSPEAPQNSNFVKIFKQNKTNINSLKKQVTTLQNQLGEACRRISEQEQVVLELNRVLSEQTSKLADHETKLAEVNRKVVENEQKMAALLNLVSSSSLIPPEHPKETFCVKGSRIASFAGPHSSNFPHSGAGQLSSMMSESHPHSHAGFCTRIMGDSEPGPSNIHKEISENSLVLNDEPSSSDSSAFIHYLRKRRSHEDESENSSKSRRLR